MLKRLLWMSIGATFGFGTSFWISRLVKRTVRRYALAPVRSRAARALRATVNHIRGAVSDGRQAMHEQEALLRAQLESRGDPGGP
jgi:hypothetical protein